MNEFITILVSYIAVIVIGFALINFLTWGFLIIYLRVKGSRGQKTLVAVRGTTRDFYKVGVLDEGWLVYTHKKKEKKRLKCGGESVFRTMGVNAVQVDEETNSVVKPDFSVASGFDAVKFENLFLRALYAPTLQSKREQFIIIALVGVIIAVAIIGFLVYKMSGQVDLLIEKLPSAVI